MIRENAIHLKLLGQFGDEFCGVPMADQQATTMGSKCLIQFMSALPKKINAPVKPKTLF
jgi:hypothetical protein